MKILYFGLSDELAQDIVQQLKKEGHKVVCVTAKGGNGRKLSCKTYEYSMRRLDSNVSEIVSFVKPEAVIYAGQIMNNSFDKLSFDDMTQFQNIVHEAQSCNVRQFIYLSSLEAAPERRDQSQRHGLIHAEQEAVLELLGGSEHLKKVILRCGPFFYGDDPYEMKNALKVFADGRPVQPIHVRDAAIAISRLVADNGEDRASVLNLCGSKAFCLKRGESGGQELEECTPVFENDTLKHLLDWTDYKLFTPRADLLSIAPENVECDAAAPGKKRAVLRHILENLVLFALFLIPQVLMKNHELFKTIDWMLIYVVVVSLYMKGILHSSFAALLASLALLLVNNTDILMTSIYSYVGYLIKVAEYIFFGVSIGYTCTMLNNRLEEKSEECELLRADHKELEHVHEQSMQIMQEYEKRMLESKDTLPKLQSIIGKLNVLYPDKIFTELLYVVADLFRTDAVAVYRKHENSNYLRLLNSIGDAYKYSGKSWDISTFPDIQKKIEDHEIAVGKPWSDEPGMTVPIIVNGVCVVVIVIKELTLETRSTYYLNIMRTLSDIISSAVNIALQYQEENAEKRYIDNTTVLNPDEFEKQLSLETEHKNSGNYSYTILTIPGRKWSDIYESVGAVIRTIDYLGLDREGRLSVILVNTASSESVFVIQRLEKLGIEAVIKE